MKSQFGPAKYKSIIDELSTLDKTKVTEASNYNDYVLALAGTQLTDLFFDKYPKKLWGIDTKNLSAKFAPRRVEIRKNKAPFHAGNGKWAGVLDNGCGHMAEIIEGELLKLGTYIEYNKTLSGLSFTEIQGMMGKSIDVLEFADGQHDLSKARHSNFTVPITAVCGFLNIEHDLGIAVLKLLALLSIVDLKVNMTVIF